MALPLQSQSGRFQSLDRDHPIDHLGPPRLIPRPRRGASRAVILTDGDRRRPRRLQHRGLIAVARAGSQVVQMRHTDSRQPLELLVSILLVLAL